MTTRWPSSCYGAVSSIHRLPNAFVRPALFRQRHGHLVCSIITSRGYADRHASNTATRVEKTALLSTTQHSKALTDPINPPRSTLPALLTLPERGQQNVLMYYFRIGRAYGSFYWAGIKAVWFNWQAAKALRERIKKTQEQGSSSSSSSNSSGGPGDKQTAMLRHLTRAEYQILQRNAHDISKLPFFGVLVMLLGEWLPLIVPFIPGAVPGTCRIPQQVRGMREKAEARRRTSFRQGIAEPAQEQLVLPAAAAEATTTTTTTTTTTQKADAGADAEAVQEWPMARRAYVGAVLARLRADQLYHLSATLDLHNRLWDRVQLPPPALLLRRGLAKRLSYLAGDDLLLVRDGGPAKLVTDELLIACEQRGIDVLGRREDVLRSDLKWWLARQQDDRGQGSAMFTMLFRRLAIRDWVKLNVDANHVPRPNAWESSSDKKRT